MTERVSARTAFAVGAAAVTGVLVTLLFVFLLSSRESSAPALADKNVESVSGPSALARIPTRVEYRDDLSFFDPMTGTPVIWYYKMADGEYHLFDAGGYHPNFGKDAPLQVVNPVIVGDIQAYFRKEPAPVRTMVRRLAPQRARQPQARSQSRELEVAAQAPAPEPAPSAPVWAPRSLSVPAGTEIQVVLDRQITTERDRAGDSFSATVSRGVSVGGEIIVPVGTEVTGTITFAERPGRVKGTASLTLVLANVLLDGGSIPIKTEPLPLQGETTQGQDAAKVGVGAAIGTGLGAIFGGGSGAAKGSVIGAGGGAGTVLATRGKDLVLPPEHKLTFTLNRDLTIQR